jgi:hypothetical protein
LAFVNFLRAGVKRRFSPLSNISASTGVNARSRHQDPIK